MTCCFRAGFRVWLDSDIGARPVGRYQSERGEEKSAREVGRYISTQNIVRYIKLSKHERQVQIKAGMRKKVRGEENIETPGVPRNAVGRGKTLPYLRSVHPASECAQRSFANGVNDGDSS